MARTFDVIVAGVGAAGSAACWQLAARGLRVLGLERFDIPHAQGSSHGETRMIRLGYFEGSGYVPLVRRAHALWDEIGARTGERLLHVTGTLDMAPAGHGVVENGAEACREHGLAHERLDRFDIARRWPQFVLPDGHIGLFQPDGGFVASERGIVAMATLALEAGAEIRAREPLLDWAPAGAGVRVTTARDTYEAGALVLATGGWIGRHAPALAAVTQPFRQVFGWFRPRDPAAFGPGRIPSFTLVTEDGHYYGFPLWNHPGFKVGGPHHGRTPCDPDTVDRAISDRDEDGLRAVLRRYIPAGDGPPLAIRTCFYTMTPDEHFILDRLPDTPQVVVASPCSGHGYKFAPALGEVLADLACGTAPAYDLEAFRLARFAATGDTSPSSSRAGDLPSR